MNRKTITVLASVAVVGFLALSPAHAQGDEAGWRFRVFAGAVCRCVESDNVTFDDPFFGTSSTEVDGTGFGFGLGVERRFTKLFGLELALGYTELDVNFNQSRTPNVATATLEVLPIWVAANFHVVNKEKLDFWLGPQIAYVSWNDPLNFNLPVLGTYAVQTSSDFPGIGFALGLDYWLTENSGINFGFRFVDADTDDTGNLPIDPTFITVGYTWKF